MGMCMREKKQNTFTHLPRDAYLCFMDRCTFKGEKITPRILFLERTALVMRVSGESRNQTPCVRLERKRDACHLKELSF